MGNMVAKIWTDGACKGNPGPAGIGVVIVAPFTKVGMKQLGFGDYIGMATNNVAEMKAVIAALERLKDRKNTEVQIFTDSQLVVGFITGKFKPRMNLNLVNRMMSLVNECAHLTVVKIKAHNGDQYNEQADALATRAINSKSSVLN